MKRCRKRIGVGEVIGDILSFISRSKPSTRRCFSPRFPKVSVFVITFLISPRTHRTLTHFCNVISPSEDSSAVDREIQIQGRKNPQEQRLKMFFSYGTLMYCYYFSRTVHKYHYLRGLYLQV